MVKNEVYYPTSQEMEMAVHGGIKYVAGVAYLHDAEATRPYHRLDAATEGSQIADTAANLMLKGISIVIKYAQRPELRSSMHKMERHYEAALPNLLDTQIGMYADEVNKLATIHFPSIAALTPMPILEEGIYKRFCHGHFGSTKLPLWQMMDDVTIDSKLKDYVIPEHNRFRDLLDTFHSLPEEAEEFFANNSA